MFIEPVDENLFQFCRDPWWWDGRIVFPLIALFVLVFWAGVAALIYLLVN